MKIIIQIINFQGFCFATSKYARTSVLFFRALAVAAGRQKRSDR